MGASVDCLEKPPPSGYVKDEKFTIGDHSFLNRKKVFCRFEDVLPQGTLQRWFPARIEGKSEDGTRFVIRWYEGDELAEADPEDVVAASDYLQPGVLVQTTDTHDGRSVDRYGKVFKSQFYQEVRIVRKSESEPGKYRVRGKGGKSFLTSVPEMMVDQVDMDTHLKRVQPVPFNKLLDGCLFTTTHPNVTRRSNSKEEAEYRVGDLDERIKTWVAAMGGKMVAYFEELTDIELTNPKKRFLIASGCCRTQRYLECLVANVPCVDYHWLKNMYYRGKMIDFEKYRLPAGYDSRGRVVEWTYRYSLLDNLRTGFYPISLNGWQATSANWWMPIVEAGRGEPVLLSPREPVVDDVDVVVVRTHVPKEVQAMCDEAMIPVVIEDWLLESIIRGKKQPFERYFPEQI